MVSGFLSDFCNLLSQNVLGYQGIWRMAWHKPCKTMIKVVFLWCMRHCSCTVLEKATCNLALNIRITSSHSEKFAIVYIGVVSKQFGNVKQKKTSKKTSTAGGLFFEVPQSCWKPPCLTSHLIFFQWIGERGWKGLFFKPYFRSNRLCR